MDRDREKILERRALFVASALSAMGCGAPQAQPQKSAPPPPPRDDAPEASALVIAETPDAGTDAAAQLDAVARVVVRVCLSIIIPPTIKFGFGSVTPEQQSLQTLDQAAVILTEHPDVCLEVQGHADSREPGGQKLSERRAKAVWRFFLDQGVDPQRVWTAGYGATRPMSRPGDARNRRVEFRAARGDDCKRDGG